MNPKSQLYLESVSEDMDYVIRCYTVPYSAALEGSLYLVTINDLIREANKAGTEGLVLHTISTYESEPSQHYRITLKFKRKEATRWGWLFDRTKKFR